MTHDQSSPRRRWQPFLAAALAWMIGVSDGAGVADTGAAAENAVQFKVRVRLFWVRHGQSCANVMDRCAAGPQHSEALLPELEHALRAYPGGRFERASLNRTVGLVAATATERDCTVHVQSRDDDDETAANIVVRAHDLYRDPALTDCARQQSVAAGRAFALWLRASRVRLRFVGSSFLMRAVETAYAMFAADDAPARAGDDAAAAPTATTTTPPGLRVTPIPYMTERAPPGMTPAEADNVPREVDEQLRMLEAAYGRALPLDDRYARGGGAAVWPRPDQHFEKFKAFLATQVLPSLGDGGDGDGGGDGGGGGDDDDGAAVPRWAPAPPAAFRAALDAALGATMNATEHGAAPVAFGWDVAAAAGDGGGDGGGAPITSASYSTGAPFSRDEYARLTDVEAPEV